MKNVLKYHAGNSVLHRLNPVTKIALAFAICVAAFATDRIPYLIFLLALDMGIGALAGIFGHALSLLKGLVKVSLLLFVLQVLVIRAGTPIFWIITDQGVVLAIKIVLRLVTACIPLALMLAVTRVSDLSGALVEKLHVPYRYAFMLTTAIRFIPQFLDEMDGIMEAQTARGVDFDAAKGFKKMSMMLPLCVPLLVTSVRRTDSAAMAAQLRGFELRTRKSAYRKYPFALRDAVTFVIGALLIAAAFI